ncbi:hypothetical protein FA95DRAFT_1676484 [Auriscalpium vulgare]|uniref:Uncharacterized protein n=1 Tax=Auriscalpium vulgare TaxID=40419 RepID=A0ACB8S4H5_9AGAM|nr:hypothetical protein FA95DRAFT_1676484 [Auriscalpium vulgare]
MNSYPPELLAQLAPVMFVAGLDAPDAVPGTPVAPTPSTPSSTPLRVAQDHFLVLTQRLREVLAAQRKPAIWQPDKAKTFQVVLVDKEVRFPPRKVPPPSDQPQAAASPHSPLSPLTPTSPLYPDGLIAPIWVRKHTALLPSVFVLFIRLFEAPPHLLPRSPLDPPHPDRENEERRKDAEMSAEIALRKKTTNERGIKLTVVLIASRKMLDDPALDTRLTFIRRQSGLDYRAALFVLSPVSPSELSEFVKSLQQALYEPAVEYYTSHSKRVRRKRNRHAQATSAYMGPISPLGSSSIARPLRPEGWTVRYEYKMACFAEFRGEDEVALKHYQDAYSTLLVMFGSTAILPPRTKRWAEAKVLADCINIKICKLYLYNNEHSLALSQHTIHIRRFSDFSRGWGIGDETFEYWSWIARQYRVFGELLEQGTRSTLKLPVHAPARAPDLAASATLPTGLSELDAMRVLGLNPASALQHPGFYYYMAAGATEKRRERFLGTLEVIDLKNIPVPPGFGNEKKVDHLAIVLELYTKSYELFKTHSVVSNGQGQGRLTLRIAYRIAQTYYASGKFDMAVRFFERIARTYRREKWGVMLKPLLATWYACAQQLGDVELSVRLLVEMLGHGPTDDADDDGAMQEDLLAVLKSTVPSKPDEPLMVDLSESEPIFDSSIVFWKSEASVNERVAFQVTLTAPRSVELSALSFASLALYFSTTEQPVIIRHSTEPPSSAGTTQKVDLGEIAPGGGDASANLRWEKGAMIIFTGTLSSAMPTTLSVVRGALTLKEGNWTIEIPVISSAQREGDIAAPRWLTSVDPVRFIPLHRTNYSEVAVGHRPHQLHVDVSHQGPAYLDEEYPINIAITNSDDRQLDLDLDVLLQPTEIDEAINDIRIDDERSSSLIKGVSLGTVAPGVTAVKTLYLRNTGAPGDRILDISIQSHAPSDGVSDEPSSPSSPSSHLADTSELLRTLAIPTVDAIKTVYDVNYVHTKNPLPGLTDLRTYDSGYWDDGQGGEAVIKVKFECAGPWGLSVEKVRLVRKNGPHAKVIDCSLDEDEDEVASEWLSGDEFAAVCRVSISTEDDAEDDDAIAGPGEYELTWRRILANGDHGPLSTTRFPLPLLQPPRHTLVALLSLPASAKLHVPMHAKLTVRNHHPTRTATLSVLLEPDGNDAFLVAGLRSGRVPTLLPGAEAQLVWTLVPVECGFVRIPRIRVLDKRRVAPAPVAADGSPAPVDEEEMEIAIIDVRREKLPGRSKTGGEELADGAGAVGPIGPVLVLPR